MSPSESVHDDDKLQAGHYGRRKLSGAMEPLMRYLQKRSRVLHVGCGPGTITLDVAGAVDPGRVNGLDAAEYSRAGIAGA